MKRQPHLSIVLSAHGFGHTTQTAPVVNALRKRLPSLRLTLRTTVPHHLLQARFDGEFEHIAVNSDIGMMMSSALDVKVEESAAAYVAFHQYWQRKIQQEARLLKGLAPDLVLSNAAYLPLAGAAAVGIPAVAMCSLNWADIYSHYCGHRQEASEIHAQILAAYNDAVGFLQTEPAMPMTDIAKRRAIGPVARVGHDRRAEIVKRLSLSEGARLILIAPGGIALRLPVEQWPSLSGIYWIVQSDWNVKHPNVIILEQLGMHFTDVLRSCDALIGKPGYGSFAEAACNGTPVLYVKRNDWPEEPYLVEWLERRGRCLEISRAALQTGDVLGQLETLWAMPVPPPVLPAGIEQAADYLHNLLVT